MGIHSGSAGRPEKIVRPYIKSKLTLGTGPRRYTEAAPIGKNVQGGG